MNTEFVQATDLRVAHPRRWSEELAGIKWLPRLIDKARAAIAGTLGDYLYGQSPLDRSLLRTLGLSYADFTDIVRGAKDDDEVLAALERNSSDKLATARAWSERLTRRHGFLLFLIDLDDGYAAGPLQAIHPVVRMGSRLAARYAKYRWPARAALLSSEIEAERAGSRMAAARGVETEPYRWLTAQRLDYSWKALLSLVLIFLIIRSVIGFLERIGPIVLVIIGAIFFAYLIYPVVRWLNKHLPLIIAILLVYATIIGLVVLGLSYLIPALGAEVTTLVHDWPALSARIQGVVNNANNPIIAHAPAPVRHEIAKLPKEIVAWIQTHGAKAASNAIAVILGTAAFIGAMVVIPVLAAYLLYDSEVIKRFFIGFIPEARRDSVLDLLAELEQVIGGFIRGQLLVGASVGALIAIGLSLVHEPYAILIGAAAGILDLIPYIGPVIAFIPAVTIGMVTNGWHEAIWVAVVFIVANQAEGHIISPNIVSRTIQLTPSAVVLAILIGGELYGVLGMFIAVPVAGIVRVLLLHIIPGSVSRMEARPVLTRDAQDVARADDEAAAQNAEEIPA